MCIYFVYRKSNMGVHAATDGLMHWVTTLLESWVEVYETSIFIGRFSIWRLFIDNLCPNYQLCWLTLYHVCENEITAMIY